MRENRPYGSEGGGTEFIRSSLPLSRTIEVRGQVVHPHRYSLCWAPYELYVPKTAEQLAALRESRERGKAEREERKFREENPLLAWADENAEPEVGRGR